MTKTEDIAWAAGFLEGEGSFCVNRRKNGYKIALIAAKQNDREPLERLQAIGDGGSICFDKRMSTKTPDGGTIQRNALVAGWYLYGAKAEDLMRTIRPLLSARRRGKVDEVLDEMEEFRSRRH